MEPADLWTERLDRNLRDRAPRLVRDPGKGGYVFEAPGLAPLAVATDRGGPGYAAIDLREEADHKPVEAFRPSGWDPAERIRDQEIDGVDAEVLYATLGLRLFRLTDVDLQQAAFRVYNDWLADYCSYAPNRLLGLGLVSLWDVDQGVRELEHCARLGFKGAQIWGAPPTAQPYHGPRYDRLWQAAQALRLPLSLHNATSMGEHSVADDASAALRSMNALYDVQRSLTSLVLGGVLERFPDLMIVAADCEAGWLPFWLQRLDRAEARHGTLAPFSLSLPPSGYVRRQVWLTFTDERVGEAGPGELWGDVLLWGSKFPHPGSSWPHSRDTISRNVAGLPDDVTRRILCDNAARLYNVKAGAGL